MGLVERLVLVISGILCTSECLEIKIGLLLTEGICCDYKSVEDKASAITIALDKLYADGVWDENNITLR